MARARDLDPDHVSDIARGRVWSGKDALRLGLVDRLGGFDAAIELARELAGLEPEERVTLEVMPRAKTFFELMMDQSVGLQAVAGYLGAGGADGVASAAPLPNLEELERWVRGLSRAQVQARMPEIRLE